MESTRDSNQGAWDSTAAACDGNLCAFYVELRNSCRPWVVDGKLLDTKKIFAIGYAGGDRNAVGESKIPSDRAVREGRADIFNFEPDVAGAVERISSATGLGHVEGGRALMVNRDISGEGDR